MNQDKLFEMIPDPQSQVDFWFNCPICTDLQVLVLASSKFIQTGSPDMDYLRVICCLCGEWVKLYQRSELVQRLVRLGLRVVPESQL